MGNEPMRALPASECDAKKLDDAIRAAGVRIRQSKPKDPFYAFYSGHHFKVWPDGRVKPVDLVTGESGRRFSE